MQQRLRQRNMIFRLGAFTLVALLCGGIYAMLDYTPGARQEGREGLNSGFIEKDGDAQPLPEASVSPAAPAAAEGAAPASTNAGAPQSAGPVQIQSDLQTEVMDSGERVAAYQRVEAINMDEAYTSVAGILTYGGGNYRDSFTYGVQSLEAMTLERIWESPVASLTIASGDTYQGTGWTGMPLIIQWDAAVRPLLGVYDMFKTKEGFTEVIYPAMDGYIYFFELSSGERSREPIYIGVVLKGSAALDPRGYPMLYVGQGIMDEVDGRGAWVRAISLIDNRVVWMFGGRDGFSYRSNQAYDASPLVDAETDTLIIGGENGVLYTTKLNIAFDPVAGSISISPDPLVKYRYTSSEYGEDSSRTWGIESSVSLWRGYAFFADNGGYLQCVDLNTMSLVYALDLGDESDATVVLSQEEDNLYLYTATLVNFQSVDASGLGNAYHRKINALSGETVWEASLPAYRSTTSSTGGTLSTPHVGRGEIAGLVIYNCTFMPVEAGGQSIRGACLIAYDKATGAERWRYEQEGGYWSSPVVVYDSGGNAYVIQCDRMGYMRLHDALTGEVLFSLDMGSRIESTPAVFGDYLVVGTRGAYGSGESAKIIGVRIS